MPVTLLNRTNGAYEFPYIDVKVKGKLEKDKISSKLSDICHCTLAPNYTTAIPDEIFEQIKVHPNFSHLCATGKFHIVKREDLKIKGTTPQGLLVVNDPIFGDDLTLSDFDTIHQKSKNYTPSADFLMQFKGVSKTVANKILNHMPESGWDNFTAMQQAVKDLPGCGDVDWTETKL